MNVEELERRFTHKLQENDRILQDLRQRAAGLYMASHASLGFVVSELRHYAGFNAVVDDYLSVVREIDSAIADLWSCASVLSESLHERYGGDFATTPTELLVDIRLLVSKAPILDELQKEFSAPLRARSPFFAIADTPQLWTPFTHTATVDGRPAFNAIGRKVVLTILLVARTKHTRGNAAKSVISNVSMPILLAIMELVMAKDHYRDLRELAFSDGRLGLMFT